MTLWNNTKEMQGQFEFVLPSPTLVWSSPLGLPRRCGGRMASTFNKWHKKNKNKKVTPPHADTWYNATMWVDFFGDLY